MKSEKFSKKFFNFQKKSHFLICIFVYIDENKKRRKIKMSRKIRGDARVGTVERKQGFPPGTFRNLGGRDTRSDKQIKNIRNGK